MGAVPTGKLVTHTGHQTERFEGGKIVESWTNWDALGLLEEIGAIPSPEQRHTTNNRETSLIYPFC